MHLKIFRKESLSNYLGADQHFVKSLSAFDLMTMGVGAVIGTGIFILPGTVAANAAGPGVIISFLLAAIVCALAAMCYAEFSSALPVAGSAYSYGNIIFGEFIGWILGWALVLEYMLAVATVSTGWSAYFNLVAVLVVLVVSLILSRGMQSSKRVNNAMVILKIVIILLFIGVGLFFIKPANYHPFMPYKISGILKGATTVFFAFLGFDAVSSSAAEVKNPKKNMPIGILGTLLIAAILYMGVSAVLVGMVKYTKLDVANPVSYALNLVNQGWLADTLAIGALIGMFTMMITTIFASSRLVYSIGRDGLLPKPLSKLNAQKGETPENALLFVTIIIAIMGGLVSLDELTSLVNIGTLLAFTFVSFGIIPLRHRQDIDNQGGFQVPLYPLLPIISGLACIWMICQLGKTTFIGAGIWFVIGIIIYFSYGYHHSTIASEK